MHIKHKTMNKLKWNLFAWWVIVLLIQVLIADIFKIQRLMNWAVYEFFGLCAAVIIKLIYDNIIRKDKER